MAKLKLRDRISGTAGLSWAIAREAGASLLTYELYPLGLVGKLPVVHPPWGKDSRPKIPILFIHGIFHNRSAFAWLAQRLAFSGFRNFKELNLLTSIHRIPRMAEQTGEQVQKLLKKYDVPQVDIIAHSMGGIIARYFIQNGGGDGKVRHLITLGTPHQGTRLSDYSVLPHFKDLSPDSATLIELNRNPVPNHTQGLAISGDLDIFMQPRQCGLWKGVRNVELKSVGHAGLLFSRRVLQLITSRLQ